MLSKEANEVNLRSVMVTSRRCGIRSPIEKPLAIENFGGFFRPRPLQYLEN